MSKKILLFSLLSVPMILQAQDTTKPATLAEVTVTASRSEQQVIAAPRSVSVITAADIRKQSYQNLADLLQRQEGIFIPGTFQNPGSLQTLFLRGADNKQTLVMIDGVRISDPSTPDNGLDLNEISLNSVERIEIVRGAQGTLYGGSAVGGVIHIITKKGAKTGVSGIVRANAGTFGKGTFVSNTQAGITYTDTTGFYGRAEVYNVHSNGFNNAVRPATGFFIDERDNFRKTDYAAKAGYNNKGWDAYIGYRKSNQKADIDDGAFKDDENNVLRFNRNLYTYGVSRNLNSNTALKFFGGYTTTNRYNYDDSSLTSLSPRTYDRATYEATYTGANHTNELQLNYSKGGLTLVSGAGLVSDKMNTNTNYISYAWNFASKTSYDTVDLKMNTAFAYAHARYAIPFGNNVLNLAGGLRYSNNNRFGNFVSYEFTPNVLIGKNVSVYANYATGFNAPSLYQMFAPERNFTSNITRGFANLNPETSQSVELGIKAIVFEKVGLRLSGYYNQVNNYIDYVYLWNGNKQISALGFSDYRGDTYLNTGKQTNKGLEAGLDIRFNTQWELHSNFSYNRGQLEYDRNLLAQEQVKGNHVQIYANGAFLTGTVAQQDLTRRPRTISNTSLVFKPTTKWQLTADARAIGRRFDVSYNPNLGPYGALDRNATEEFVLFSLSAYYQVTQQLSAAVNAFNILNKEYVELQGFQTRGRSIFATVQYNF